MAKIRKSKTDTTFFQDIPKKIDKREVERNLLKFYNERSQIRQKLIDINRQKVDLRKELYNATADMNRLDSKIDQWQAKYNEVLSEKEE